jgi:AcrR family transcriptional regulator
VSGSASAPDRTTLRSDAERNRDRILAAATEVFAEEGLDASLGEIARRAGVGIGTLYRRFPTRADLITACFEHKLAGYVEVVRLASEIADAWAGFCSVIVDLCRLQAADAGLKDLLAMSYDDSPTVEALKQQAADDLAGLITRAQQQGQLRPDFVLSDFALVQLANAGVVGATHREAPDAWRRFAAYLIDAFSAEGATPLPPPPGDAEYDAALRSHG